MRVQSSGAESRIWGANAQKNSDSDSHHRIALLDQIDGDTYAVTVSLDGKNVKTTSLPLALTGIEPRVRWAGDDVIVRTDQDAVRIHPQTGKTEAALPADGQDTGCGN